MFDVTRRLLEGIKNKELQLNTVEKATTALAELDAVETRLEQLEAFYRVQTKTDAIHDEWWCMRCMKVVRPTDVTYEEYHDGCGGRCV